MEKRFTQAICDKCWSSKEEYGKDGARPVRILDAPKEICCFCGEETQSGIYIRIDPNSVPYPQKVT